MHILAYNYRRLAHSDRRKFRTKMFGEIGFYDSGSFFALLRDSREKNARDHVDEIDNFTNKWTSTDGESCKEVATELVQILLSVLLTPTTTYPNTESTDKWKVQMYSMDGEPCKWVTVWIPGPLCISKKGDLPEMPICRIHKTLQCNGRRRGFRSSTCRGCSRSTPTECWPCLNTFWSLPRIPEPFEKKCENLTHVLG